MKKQFLEAGRIVGTHGVRGEMRVEPWCDSAEFLKKLKRLYFDEGRADAGLVASRVHKSFLLVRLEGVENATQADLYRGRVLYLDRNDVRLPENRYFVSDLIGLSVIDDATGTVYGTVQDVFETGANNVYRRPGGRGIPLPGRGRDDRQNGRRRRKAVRAADSRYIPRRTGNNYRRGGRRRCGLTL